MDKEAKVAPRETLHAQKQCILVRFLLLVSNLDLALASTIM
jgi:hypothetical protein